MADNGSFACFSERASEQGCNREAAAVFPSPPSIIFYGKMGNIIQFGCVIYTYFSLRDYNEKIPMKKVSLKNHSIRFVIYCASSLYEFLLHMAF